MLWHLLVSHPLLQRAATKWESVHDRRTRRFFIAGGAGFIGSHFTDRLLCDKSVEAVTLYDNFSSGREWHYAHHEQDRRLRVICGDVKDLAALERNMDGHDTVIHLASNPDIARAAVEPDIDFREGTFLTQQVVEAMRRTRTPDLLYASGSGVYGDLGRFRSARGLRAAGCPFPPTAQASWRARR